MGELTPLRCLVEAMTVFRRATVTSGVIPHLMARTNRWKICGLSDNGASDAWRLRIVIMLSNDELEAVARKHLRKNFPSDCEILSRTEHAEPDGVYFYANRRTDDPMERYFCMQGFFVRRSTGHMYQLGQEQTGNDLSHWLGHYAEQDDLGLEQGFYRLTVHSVEDKAALVGTLVEFDARYAVLELETGTVWTSWELYDEQTIRRRLKELPAAFLVPTDCVAAVLKEDQARSGNYSYAFIGEWLPKYSRFAADYEEGALGPQWD